MRVNQPESNPAGSQGFAVAAAVVVVAVGGGKDGIDVPYYHWDEVREDPYCYLRRLAVAMLIVVVGTFVVVAHPVVVVVLMYRVDYCCCCCCRLMLVPLLVVVAVVEVKEGVFLTKVAVSLLCLRYYYVADLHHLRMMMTYPAPQVVRSNASWESAIARDSDSRPWNSGSRI